MPFTARFLVPTYPLATSRFGETAADFFATGTSTGHDRLRGNAFHFPFSPRAGCLGFSPSLRGVTVSPHELAEPVRLRARQTLGFLVWRPPRIFSLSGGLIPPLRAGCLGQKLIIPFLRLPPRTEPLAFGSMAFLRWRQQREGRHGERLRNRPSEFGLLQIPSPINHFNPPSERF